LKKSARLIAPASVRASGKVNLLGVAILAGLTVLVWWCITYVPVHMDHLEVKEAVKAAANQAKTDNEKNAWGVLISKMNYKTLGWHREEDEAGVLVKKGGLGVKDEQVTVEKNDVTNLITVTVEYTREIERWPFKNPEFKKFYFQHTTPLK
jgi:hypothetical protein